MVCARRWPSCGCVRSSTSAGAVDVPDSGYGVAAQLRRRPVGLALWRQIWAQPGAPWWGWRHGGHLGALVALGLWATSPCASAPRASDSTRRGVLRRVPASAAPLLARPVGTGAHLRGAGRRACLRCRAQLRRLRARSAGAGRPGRGCPESHEVCCGSGEGCGASGAARGGRDGGPFRDLVVWIWRRGRRLASLWPSWTCLLLAHLGVHFGML